MTNQITTASEKLWSLLDDIDTLSDAIKPRDEVGYKAFYEATMKKVAKRFEVHSSDGYVLLPVKPTIHELEAILEDDALAAVINPDGSVSTRPKGTDDAN